MNASEAGGDLVLIQTSLLFLYMATKLVYYERLDLHMTKAVSSVSKQGHL